MLKQSLWTHYLKAWPLLSSLGLHTLLIGILLNRLIEIPPQNSAVSSLKVNMNNDKALFLETSVVEQTSQTLSEQLNPLTSHEPISSLIKNNKNRTIKTIKKQPSKKMPAPKISLEKKGGSHATHSVAKSIEKIKAVSSEQGVSSHRETDREPIALKKIKPVYPQRALALGIEGKIKVQYDIDHQGRVNNIRLLESTPPNTFERSVKTAMKKWKFEANPFKDRVTVIVFKLRNNEGMVK